MIKGISTRIVFICLFVTIRLTAQSTINPVHESSTLPIISEGSEHLPIWVLKMYDKDSNLAEITAAYDAHYKQNEFVKNQHTQYYKRLIRQHGRTTYDPTKNPDYIRSKANDFAKRRKTNQKTIGQWNAVGPSDLDISALASGNTPGTAHIYQLSFCKGLEQHILAGTATAGLWKSSNNASSWELITHDLPVNTVTAMSYQPNNPSIIYFSAGNNFYKSTNGGTTWQQTGGSQLNSISYVARKLIVDHNSTSILYLATNKGLYKSIDSGLNFDLILSGNIQDVLFHPTNTQIIYVINQSDNKTEFYRSEDTGLTFISQESGFPIPTTFEEQKRTTIAVSEDEPNSVWALAVGKMNGGDGLVGIYKSENNGETWIRTCCGEEDGGAPSLTNPNIMEWECGGENPGGQYYYDLALGVNPDNSDELVTGGINLWVSEDGGSNLSCHSDFIYRHNPDTYVHADIHDIEYVNGNVWVASDGGVFMSSDNLQTFQKKMNGIRGTDFRGFDIGFYNKEIMLGGTYHNGTLLKEEDAYVGEWVSTRSGDNSRAYINDGDNSIIYDHTSMRELTGTREKIPHNVSMSRKPNASFSPGASSEIVFDPFQYNRFFLGSGGKLFKTENNGVTFDLVKSFGSGNVTAIEVSVTIPGLMYAVYYPSFSAEKKIFRSNNNGVSWEDVTPPTSLYNSENTWVAFDITIGSHSPFDIWAARVPLTTSNLSLDDNMIYYSSDGGDSWSNVTTESLDGEYPTNIVHQEGTNGGVYLGTRRGVYYRSHLTNDWELLSNGLPASTFSTKLIPHYKSGKIINATQRGVYEFDFVSPSSGLAVPMVNKRKSDCLRDTFYFLDRSPTLENATRLWTFEGADITSSVEMNPKVTYSEPGLYPVKLEEFTSNGNSSFQSLQFIEVKDGCKLDDFVGKSLITGNNSYAKIPPFKRSFDQMTISGWVKRQGAIFNDAGIVMHRDGPTGTGLRLNSSGYLAYLWDEFTNDFQSGLYVPYNKWAHVAMTVDSSGVTLYVDGKSSKDTRNIGPNELIEFFLIGTDEFAITNYMSGNIDEISVYDKALTSEEIQLCMNLTHEAAPDGLISYFQANNETGLLTDRVGFSHAFMMEEAGRIQSMAPVSGGCAEMHEIDMPGTYDFDCAGVSMTFLPGDKLPIGPVTVAKLNELPDLPPPTGTKLSESYWVFNNYGVNTSITAPRNLKISGFGEIDSMYVDHPEFYQFYMVPNYWEYGWGVANDIADSVSLENNTEIMFEQADGMTYLGKIIMSEEGLPVLSFLDIQLEAKLEDEYVELSWKGMGADMNYRLMRSVDGQVFKEIESGRTTYSGNPSKTYIFDDKNDIFGRLYYKVIAEDEEGGNKESEIASVYKSNKLDVQYFPSLLKMHEPLTIISQRDGLMELLIYDIHGRKVKQTPLKNSTETVALNLDQGTYFIEIKNAENHIQGKIVIQ